MTEKTNEPSHLPIPDAKIEVRGYYTMVRFYPEIKLDRKKGHLFAASLSDYLVFEKDEFESHKWTFIEPMAGEAASKFIIVVGPSSIRLDVRFPSQVKQELIESRFHTVLTKFNEQFRPELHLGSEVTVRGTFPIDGDARTFLGGHVMIMNPDRLDQFGRPVHLVGLRLFFPPFTRGEGDQSGPIGEDVEWSVNVRAESLMEDPSRMFLEAEADWFNDVRPWTKELTNELVSRLETVKTYLEKNVVQFLTQADDDIDNDPGGQDQ